MDGSLFYKGFCVSGLGGHYLEFGSYTGGSMIEAYRAAKSIADDLLGSKWDHSLGEQQERAERKAWFRKCWDEMRFVAFDSFEGTPHDQSVVDRHYHIFPGGSYACPQLQFERNLGDAGLDMEKIIAVPGFFSQTLTSQTAERIGLKEISVAHIDSDLYDSAKLALDFCTPYFRDGSVVIFDEWFQFHGNPYLGEQRAFSEWRAANPKWTVTDYATRGPWSKAFILSLRPF